MIALLIGCRMALEPYPHRVWLPSEAAGAADWPVLLYLHGSGVAGDDLSLLETEGLPALLLTVYPQTGHDAWRQAYADPALVDWLLAQHR